jgi:hypothetical protein
MILPSWLLILFFLTACTEAKEAEFGIGKKLIWIVDFRNVQPRGVFCSRLEASIVNAGVNLRNQRPFRERIGETMMQHQGLPSIFNVQVELGVVYRVEWIVRHPQSILESLDGRYRLILECVHPKYSPRVFTEKDLSHLPRYIIAWSKPFVLRVSRYRPWNSPSSRDLPPANIVDISPKEHYIDNPDNSCLISLDVPRKPVIDDFGHTFDLSDFLKYRSENSLDPATCCLMKHTFRSLSVHERIFAYACRFHQSVLNRIENSSWWERIPNLMLGANLETEAMFSLPNLDLNRLTTVESIISRAWHITRVSSRRLFGNMDVVSTIAILSNSFALLLLNASMFRMTPSTIFSHFARYVVLLLSTLYWLFIWFFLLNIGTRSMRIKPRYIDEHGLRAFVDYVVSGYGFPDISTDAPLTDSLSDIV